MPNPNGTILSHWHISLENVMCSPLDFYQSVIDLIEQKGFPNINFTEITRNEGGWFSRHQRIYLRVRQNHLFFDICAFPMGNSFTISSWLQEGSPGTIDLFSEIPILGYVIEKTIHASNFYTVDTVMSFQRMVHNSVLQIVDELTDDFEMERIPNQFRQPILTQFFK